MHDMRLLWVPFVSIIRTWFCLFFPLLCLPPSCKPASCLEWCRERNIEDIEVWASHASYINPWSPLPILSFLHDPLILCLLMCMELYAHGHPYLPIHSILHVHPSYSSLAAHAYHLSLNLFKPIFLVHCTHPSRSRMAMHSHAWPPPFIPTSSSLPSQLNQWQHWSFSSSIARLRD